MSEYHIKIRINAKSLREAIDNRFEGEVISSYEENSEDFIKGNKMGYGGKPLV